MQLTHTNVYVHIDTHTHTHKYIYIVVRMCFFYPIGHVLSCPKQQVSQNCQKKKRCTITTLPPATYKCVIMTEYDNICVG